MANPHAALVAKLDLMNDARPAGAPPGRALGLSGRLPPGLARKNRQAAEPQPAADAGQPQFAVYPFSALPLAASLLAVASAAVTGDQVRTFIDNAATFARLANFIPREERYAPDGTYLWDVYERVLGEAQLGRTAESAGARDQWLAARRFLFRPVQNAAGETVDVESPEYARYLELEREWRAVSARCREAEIRAAYSDDAATRAAAEAELPALRDAVSRALIEWAARGNRQEVENQIAVLSATPSVSVQTAWQHWNSDYRAAARTDLAGAAFRLTRLPAIDPAALRWVRMTLRPSEITNLAALRESGGTSLRVESFEMEICTLPIVRSWFSPALLTSRFWRWLGPPLSDGRVPAHGLLPAYPTEVILGRNVHLQADDATALGPVTAGIGMQIVGFLCRRIPLSPDPAPTYFTKELP